MNINIKEIEIESVPNNAFRVGFVQGSEDREVQIWGEEGEIVIARTDIIEFITALKDFA